MKHRIYATKQAAIYIVIGTWITAGKLTIPLTHYFEYNDHKIRSTDFSNFVQIQKQFVLEFILIDVAVGLFVLPVFSYGWVNFPQHAECETFYAVPSYYSKLGGALNVIMFLIMIYRYIKHRSIDSRNLSPQNNNKKTMTKSNFCSFFPNSYIRIGITAKSQEKIFQQEGRIHKKFKRETRLSKTMFIILGLVLATYSIPVLVFAVSDKVFRYGSVSSLAYLVQTGGNVFSNVRL